MPGTATYSPFILALFRSRCQSSLLDVDWEATLTPKTAERYQSSTVTSLEKIALREPDRDTFAFLRRYIDFLRAAHGEDPIEPSSGFGGAP